MKKITLLLSAVLCIFVSLNAQEKLKLKSHNDRPSEKLIYRNSSAHDILWKSKWWLEKGNQGPHFKSGDTKHSLDSVLTYFGWDDAELFELGTKEIYEYDENGLNTAFNFLSNEYSDDFIVESRTEYSYADGKIDNIIDYSIYDYENPELMPITRTDYFYNEDASIKKVLMSEYDEANDDWTSIMKVDYVYNDMKMVSTTLISLMDNDIEYAFAVEQVYYTDDKKFDKIEVFIDWELSGDFVLSALADYEYENSLLYSETSWSLDDNNSLVLEERYIYGYDANDFINSEIYSQYDPDDKVWVDVDKIEYINSEERTLDNTYMPLQMDYPEGLSPYNYGVFDEENGYSMYDAWVYEYRSKYYYNELGSGVAEQTSYLNWTAYPNPANNEITLDLQNTGQVNCRIIDATGRTIISKQVVNGQTIDLSGIKNGYYLMQLHDGLSQSQVIQFIKQ